MKNLLAQLTGLLLVFAGVGHVKAQIKFSDFGTQPEKKPIKLIVFQVAKDRIDLKHGTLVSLTLNDGTEIRGHVVYLDTKEKRLFIRRSPGSAPVGYAENDIKKISKAVRSDNAIAPAGFAPESWNDLPSGLQENAQGVIRIKPKSIGQTSAVNRSEGGKLSPAVHKEERRPGNVVEPEIFRQVIYNGSMPTLTYYSKVISPDERNTLVQLQLAENKLQVLAHRNDFRESEINVGVAMRAEQLRMQRLINLTLLNENVNIFPLAQLRPSPGLLPGPFLPVVAPVATPPVGGPEMLPNMDPQLWHNTVEDLQRLRGMAVYEDGRLAAVLPKK